MVESFQAAGYRAEAVNAEDDIDRIGHAVEVLRPALVVNLVEQIFSDTLQSAYVAGLLELYGYTYVGSEAGVLNLCQERARTHVLLSQAGLPITPFEVVRDINAIDVGDSVGFPQIVTQAFDDIYDCEVDRGLLHSTEEVIAHCHELAADYELPLLVERFLPGRRVYACVIGNRVLEVLPLVQSEEEGFAIAQLDEDTAGQIRDLARRAFRVMGLRDVGQIDFAFDEAGKPLIVDVRACVDLFGPAFRTASEQREGGIGRCFVDILRHCHRRLPAKERDLYSLTP